MGYSFEGVFISDSPPSVSEAAQLFHGYAREISQPFRGIGISFSDVSENEEEMDGTHEEIQEKRKEDVLRCSKALRNATVVYIDYSTFGGPCEHCYGFACKNGELIAESEMETDDWDDDCKVLRHLIRYLGVELESCYFKPFERGFFPNT